ncbi:hypothetical protein IJ843_01595 [bacterium]|nr:hypothetical protein [bacterium]
MGMSASQARLLSITSRMNDIEYKSQQVANIKMRLASESEQVATDYTNALNKQKFTYTTYTKEGAEGQAVKISLNSSTLAQAGLKLMKRNSSAAKTTTAVAEDPTTANCKAFNFHFIDWEEEFEEEPVNRITSIPVDFEPIYSTQTLNSDGVPTKFNESQLYEMIESGEFYLADATTGEEVSVSGTTKLAIESDTTELAKAEADYNAKTLKINNKEKKLDMEMKALDTEHSALSTEYDSVKQLIGDNVEKSFNLFS